MQLFQKRLQLIYHLLIGSRMTFFLAILFSMLYNIFHSLIPQVVRIVVDSVVGTEPFQVPDFIGGYLNELGGRDFFRSHLYLCALSILVIALLSGICDFLSRITIATSSESFMERLRNRLFSHISRLPYDWHVKHQTGDMIQRCTSDAEVVRRFISFQTIEVLKVSFLILVSVSIMWTMNRTLTWITIIFIPIVIIYSSFFFQQIAKHFLEADEAEGELSSIVQENLTGVRVVRAFGREAYELERFDEKNHAFADAWIRMGKLNGFFWGFGDFFTSLQILCIVIAGTFLAVNGTITSGEFIAFVSYNAALVWPIRTLGRVFVDMSKAFVSIDRIHYILDATQEMSCTFPINNSSKEKNTNKRSQASKQPSMSQNITFEQVHYAYKEDHPILSDLNFTIPAGSTFAILGGTGSGKTTLMHLLNRLYELPTTCGSIRIGGTDIREIDLDYLRSNVGMVLQEPFLFSKSIAENIGITKPDCTQEEIVSAASIACIHESIMEFAHGYDTIVGERGVTLSGGQKQRVAIARMLLQKAPIMIFDDSLSAVDNETDIKIRTSLRTKLKESTVILISHRITTLMEADQILVLDKGSIAQLGTHESLLHEQGIYQDIYRMQMHSDQLKEV